MLTAMKLLAIFSLILASISAENPAVEEFTTANNQFTNGVYKQISKTETGNFLVSPFSAETVLAFAQSGCRGETAEELRNALRLPNDKDKVESAIKSLLPKFKDNGLYTLQSANKMYVKKNFRLKDGFKNAATSVYQADSEEIDFTKNVEAAKSMNDWVEKHTNNKIKDLISADDLDAETRAVLINALYFKANWSNPFLLTSTRKSNFYRKANDVVQVDTLVHYGKNFNYYECPHMKAQFLELPFKGEEASMVIVLPNEKEGLSALESQLDKVFSPPHELQEELLHVLLPKFKIETTVDFKSVLRELGVSKIFDANEADLSGVAGDKGDLVLNKVEQKTYIDVSEEGVEAAAATYYFASAPGSAPAGVPKIPKDFIADHPFIFYIKVKDLIIFAGRVTDPSES